MHRTRVGAWVLYLVAVIVGTAVAVGCPLFCAGVGCLSCCRNIALLEILSSFSMANASGWGEKYVPEMVDFFCEDIFKRRIRVTPRLGYHEYSLREHFRANVRDTLMIWKTGNVANAWRQQGQKNAVYSMHASMHGSVIKSSRMF
jgi:hypothetical protein